jgi:hypothetical protein
MATVAMTAIRLDQPRSRITLPLQLPVVVNGRARHLMPRRETTAYRIALRRTTMAKKTAVSRSDGHMWGTRTATLDGHTANTKGDSRSASNLSRASGTSTPRVLAAKLITLLGFTHVLGDRKWPVVPQILSRHFVPAN